jgi:hypothetical protein
MEKKNYKLSTWKLEVKGEFESEEEAIKSLSDSYMTMSKCDPPGEHTLELLFSAKSRDLSTISKRVYFYIEEVVYGNKQWIHKLTLNIHPFKQEHWWESINKDKPFQFKETDFKYEVVEPENKNP